MSTKVTFTENKTKDKVIDVICQKCRGRTKHRVTGSFDEDGCECNERDQWGVEWANHYQIIQCQGCETVSFRHVDWCSENVFPGENGVTERLYPARDMNTLEAKNLLNAPTALRHIYREVIDCYNNRCWILAAAGLRGIVEGICADQSVTDGPVAVSTDNGDSRTMRKSNLEGKISGLYEKGILTKKGADTLHVHRYMGNDAIHELTGASADNLKLAIEIVEHTLDQLYEIPRKVFALNSERDRKKVRYTQ